MIRFVAGWLCCTIWVVVLILNPGVALVLTPLFVFGLWGMSEEPSGGSIPYEVVSCPEMGSGAGFGRGSGVGRHP